MANGIKFGSLDISKLMMGGSEVSKIYLGTNVVYEGEAVDYDALANNAINTTLQNVSVSFSNTTKNMTINFTPITDTTLLNAIEQNKTKIRAQLLIHSPSSGGWHPAGSSTKSREHPLWLDANKFINPDGDGLYAIDPKRVLRRYSHDPLYYGYTWLNLSKAQLAAGQAQLISGNNAWNKYDNGLLHSGRITYFSWNDYYYGIELYVPALGPGKPDTFYYERDGNCAVSDMIRIDPAYINDTN